MEWRDLPKQQILPYVGYFCNLGGFLHSACAAVGMTYVPGFGYYKQKCTTTPAYAGWRWIIAATLRSTIHPHGLYSERSRNGTQAVPYGFAGEWFRLTAQVVFGTLLGDESSPLHCVVPFNRTLYIRSVPGTARRPFPTYFNGRVEMNDAGRPMIVNCPLSISSFIARVPANRMTAANTAVFPHPPGPCGPAGRFFAGGRSMWCGG